MNGYNLYGLKANTDFEWHHLKRKKSYVRPDVEINLGKIDPIAPNLPKTVYTKFHTYNSNCYIQDIPSIAKYAIYGKDKIIIEPYKPIKPKAISYFLQENILPILLISNEYFLVHASAVATKDGVHLFTSQRGNGKSSLAANLCIKHECQFVSDNLCLLKWDETEQSFVTKCLDNTCKLWQNVFPQLDKNIKKYKPQLIRKGIHKYNLNFNRYACKQFKKVKTINFISVINDKIDLSTEKITGFKKINFSRSVMHSHHIARVVAKDQHLFKFSGLVAKHANFYKIDRSQLTSLSEFSNYIKDEILTETT